MGNLRKMLGSDLTGSSLKASDLREVPLDRIYALSGADALGSALWRLKYAYDSAVYEKAVFLLSSRLRNIRCVPEERRRLCKTVLREWLDDNCRSCGGRKFIMATTSKAQHVCTVCDGTGLKRYSDQWRMRQMNIDPAGYVKWESRFAMAHAKIADADFSAWRDSARRLGWIPTPEEERNYLAKYEIRATLAPATADGDGA